MTDPMDELFDDAEVFIESSRPRENGFQRLVRLHFRLTVIAAVVWSVASMIIVRHAPDWFPARWDLYNSRPHHNVDITAVMLIATEVVATFTVYLRGGPMARFIAFFVGGYLIIAFGVVEPALASLRLPIQIWEIVVMLWIGAGHMGYALFGSSELLR